METQNEKKSSKLFRILPFVFVFLCVAGLIAFGLILVQQLQVGLGQSPLLEEVPLLQLLWKAVKGLCSFCAPVLLPLLAILLLCFFLFVAKKLSTETRRFGKLRAGTASLLVIEALQEFCFSLLRHVPLLVLVLLTAIGLNSLFLSVNQVKRVADNLKRVKELGIMVRNLSRSEDLARITLLRQNRSSPNPSDVEKVYRVEILSEGGDCVSEQEVTLQGNRIAIDSIMVNFEYSEIESGKRQNIAYPYRVYSELMRPDDAVALNCMFNGEGLPVIYCLEDDAIYGMEKDVFFKRLKELFEILKDDEQSRELGIRSANGTVNHFVMEQGDVYFIRVEATGGLTVHKKPSLD